MPIQISALRMILVITLGASGAGAAEPSSAPWHDDYLTAFEAARGKMLLVWFYDPSASSANKCFESDVLGQLPIAAAIEERHVAVKLPLTAAIASDSGPLTILKHSAFVELRGQPGLAIVDLTEPGGSLYGLVVSAYPFTRGPITAAKLAVLLDLPRGTLTQRTLTCAVRTHAAQPASADSHLSPLLVRETASHALHQATITLQGHHHWQQRFQAINAQLPAGLVAYEVCAESWPGQDLIAAAEECVDSWRQSSGHWDLVSRRHVLFGYDMQRGANGVWYAAGIFAR